jgi:hypothetical protein
MEVGAKYQRDRPISVPARLDHFAIGDDSFECELQPRIRTAGIDHEVSLPRCPRTVGEVDTEMIGYRLSCRVHIDERHRDAGDAVEQARDAATDHPRTNNRDAIADHGSGIPKHIDRRFDGARKHGPARRDSIRHRYDGVGAYDKRGLVGEERENDLSPQNLWSLLDDADVEVPVFDRPWKIPLLEGCPHPVALALRYVSAEDGDFGAPTDAGVQSSHEDFVVTRFPERFVAKNANARRLDPERGGIDHTSSLSLTRAERWAREWRG